MRLESTKTRMNGTDVRENSRWLLRGFVWVGKAALFCLGVLAMLTLVVVTIVLTAVMLAATILPGIGANPERVPRRRRGSGNTSGLSTTRKVVAG